MRAEHFQQPQARRKSLIFRRPNRSRVTVVTSTRYLFGVAWIRMAPLMKTDHIPRSLTAIAALAFVALMPSRVLAHCDGMDGPVVKAAQQGLATNNVNLVLIWVPASDEAEIKNAFAKTMAVSKLNPEAKELADMYFFETLVRIHRAGEGEPYTGVKPAGRDLGPAIPAADKAIGDGSVGPLIKMLTDTSAAGIRERFQQVLATRNFKKEDVRAGREYVKAYVEFVHYAEGLYATAHGSNHEHSHEPER